MAYRRIALALNSVEYTELEHGPIDVGWNRPIRSSTFCRIARSAHEDPILAQDGVPLDRSRFGVSNIEGVFESSMAEIGRGVRKNRRAEDCLCRKCECSPHNTDVQRAMHCLPFIMSTPYPWFCDEGPAA